MYSHRLYCSEFDCYLGESRNARRGVVLTICELSESISIEQTRTTCVMVFYFWNMSDI